MLFAIFIQSNEFSCMTSTTVNATDSGNRNTFVNPWVLSQRGCNAILEEDVSSFYHPFHGVLNATESNVPTTTCCCPVCGGKLSLSPLAFKALLNGDEFFEKRNVPRTLRRHCASHHSGSFQFWLGTEVAFKLGDQVSLLYLAQKCFAKLPLENQ
jgi:hypothetical protein